MRFAIKTSPQNTTWADMLAVWQAADEIELFESAWTFDHFYPIFTDESSGDCLEGWITTPPSPRRPAGCGSGVLVTGDAVPPSGGARQDGRHPRHRLGRAARARHRRGLEPGGGEGLRHRPPRDAHRALRRVRRGVRGDHRPADQRDARPSTAATCSSPTRTATRSRSSSRTRRSASVVRASGARSARWRASRSTGTSRAVRSSSSRRSSTCCARTAPTSGATRRRSRCRRTCRGALRDAASTSVVDQAKRYADAGLDLGIVYLPTPLHPDVLDDSPPRLRRTVSPARRCRRRLQRVQPAVLRSTQVGQIG